MFKNIEQTVVITFGGTECEKDSLLFVATKISRKLSLRSVNNIIFDLNNSEFRNDFESRIPQNSVYLILEPYYYISNDRYDIRTILDSKKMRYTGPSISASEKTANKALSKQIINSCLIKNITDKTCKTTDDIYSFVNAMQFESYIVKPIDKGGGEDVFLINKENIDDFDFETLINRHKTLIIEEYIKGIELAVPILKYDNNYIDFPIVGITLSGVDIFNAHAKNSKSFSQIIPYELNNEDEAILRNYAKDFYKRIGFNGLLRVDFILRNTELYFLEANSYPNLDELSGISVPSAKKIGLNEMDLINMMIKERYVYGI